MSILVTGGAGYIGSHIVKQLSESGRKPIVLDNLSTGHSHLLIHGEKLISIDLFDFEAVDRLFEEHQFESIIHCAASIVVPESMGDPLKYYRNNTQNTLNLLSACLKHKVKNFLFSSTAAVYGIPEGGVAFEDSALAPINPYGASKMMSERILQDLHRAYDRLNFVILRYFNVAGADPQARIGQISPKPTHLIKVACQVALGLIPKLEIFGTDYSTPDGTCIRDYIHIEDLADAHLKALTHLEHGGRPLILNCGYGKGASVYEIVALVKEVSGINFMAIESPRRAGDPPSLIAHAEKIRTELGWVPKYNSLQKIIQHAWAWEQKCLKN
ncbi:MAG: UDP-glucose 4-epimerase GalE [Candidatus Caenarcaniphilales bacterium]|nr:UDP-glucose 4-epimerase GalE [Candidatus Caenarcaniphilales bacterium]